jgi:hypothetical protein
MKMAQVKESTESSVDQAAIVNAVLQSLGPILDRVALTPETINEIKKPYIDPLETARKKRERQEMAAEIAKGLEDRKRAQDYCPHKHDGKTAISLVNNHPDGRIRGMCNMCIKPIQPAHWEIAADGTPFVVPEDKEYREVLELDSSTVAGY